MTDESWLISHQHTHVRVTSPTSKSTHERVMSHMTRFANERVMSHMTHSHITESSNESCPTWLIHISPSHQKSRVTHDSFPTWKSHVPHTHSLITESSEESYPTWLISHMKESHSEDSFTHHWVMKESGPTWLNSHMKKCPTLLISHMKMTHFALERVASHMTNSHAVWRRCIGCLKLQFCFRRKATNYRVLLRKMIYNDKESHSMIYKDKEFHSHTNT